MVGSLLVFRQVLTYDDAGATVGSAVISGLMCVCINVYIYTGVRERPQLCQQIPEVKICRLLRDCYLVMEAYDWVIIVN